MKRTPALTLSLPLSLLLVLAASCGDDGDEPVPNKAPVVTAFTATPASVETSKTATLAVTVSDPEGDTLKFTYYISSGGGTLTGTDTASGKIFNAPAAAGTSVVKVLVSDGELSASKDLSITVKALANSNPVITSFTATPAAIDPLGTTTLAAKATDVDGDTPVYSYSLVSGKGSLVQSVYTSTTTPEKATFKVTVTDGKGGQSTATTSVIVKGWAAFAGKTLPAAGTWNSNDPHLGFDSKGVPYLAVQTYVKPSKLGVFSYDASKDTWTAIKSSDGDLTSEASTEGRIFVYKDLPYVAYIHSDSAKSITKNVVVRSGAKLTVLGGGAVTTKESNAPRIVVNATGDVFVAYTEKATGAPYMGGVPMVAMLKSGGKAWSTPAALETTTTVAGKLELYYANKTVYASYYLDKTYDLRIKKYSAGSWVAVGATGAPTKVKYPALAFSSTNIYLVYTDQATGHEGKLSASTFDGTSWKSVGAQGFTAGDVKYTEQVQAVYDAAKKVLYATCRNRRPSSLSGLGHTTRDLHLFKFDGTKWDGGTKYQFDTAPASTTDESGGGDDLTFSTDPSGDVYLTFQYRTGTNGADLQVKILKLFR